MRHLTILWFTWRSNYCKFLRSGQKSSQGFCSLQTSHIEFLWDPTHNVIIFDRIFSWQLKKAAATKTDDSKSKSCTVCKKLTYFQPCMNYYILFFPYGEEGFILHKKRMKSYSPTLTDFFTYWQIVKRYSCSAEDCISGALQSDGHFYVWLGDFLNKNL